jgi:hypothetical protein
VQVYPALLAPCRTDLVAGRSLSDAFRKYVLEDPEFTALAEHAARQNPEARSIVKEGQAGGADNDWRWPVELSRFSSLTDVINGRRSFWDKQAMADESYRDAYEVLWDRYKHLLSLFKSGDILAKGTHVGTGNVVGIDVVQWSRRGLWVDVRNGDLLEEENQKFVLKWTGLTLEKAAPLFHVQPTEPDSVPSATFSGRTPRASTKGVLRVETKAKSLKACQSWLEQEMHTSPKLRLKPKSNYKEEALEIWQGTITKRAFDRCWENAIQATNAIAWSLPGAPLKNHRGRNHRAD